MNLSSLYLALSFAFLSFPPFLTFVNYLLINLFLFITKAIHNDKLQSLVFFKEYNLLISSSNESFKKNTNSPVSAPHSIRGIFTPL